MTVSSSTNRVSYSGNGSNTTFAYTFKVFDQDDLTVILRSADGTETTQTITTHYSVTGVGNAGGGNVVFVTAPAATETVVILREQGLVQELDLVPNDPFPAGSLEDAIDKIVFMVQQHEETLGRTIKASKTNTITGSEFTISAADRANKIFAFDGSGDVSITQEIGTYRGNWAASTSYNPRDIVKDTDNNNIYIANTAHTSSGTVPLSTNADIAKWDLLVDAASATASATAAAASASAAATSETNAASSATDAQTAQTAAETAQTAAEAAQSAAETAYDNFDDRYLGDKASDPTLDNDGNALLTGALYYNTTDSVMKVYSGSAWSNLKISAAEQANIDTVATNIASVNTVAGIDTDVTAVAAVDTDVTAVAGVAANVTTVAGISANVTTVAGISANVVTVADSAANISTVATNIANVNLVGGSITNVNTVATNIADVNNFANVYRIGASDPTTSLDTGDLFYNTTDSQLKVYNGTGWEAGVLAGSGTLQSANNLSDVSSASASLANLGLTAVAAELNILDGATVTTAELNILDGATVTTAELNLLDGVTATTAELNYVDVTTLGTSEASKAVTADANGVVIFDAGIVEDETAVTSTTNATTINCQDGNVFTHTLTENTTFTFSNAPASGRAFAFTLKLVQDASASGFTVTWPTSVDWPSATAPTLTATASAVDVFVFYTHDGGTTFYGFVAGQALG